MCITDLICSVVGGEMMTNDCTEIYKKQPELHIGSGIRKGLHGCLNLEQVFVF